MTCNTDDICKASFKYGIYVFNEYYKMDLLGWYILTSNAAMYINYVY